MKPYLIDAGELTERVELYSGAKTQDSFGQGTIAWTLDSTEWAKRVPMRADERFDAAQTQSDVVERFFIRAHSTVADTWRLVWITGTGSPSYDIVGVTALPGRAFTEILARRGVKDGR